MKEHAHKYVLIERMVDFVGTETVYSATFYCEGCLDTQHKELFRKTPPTNPDIQFNDTSPDVNSLEIFVCPGCGSRTRGVHFTYCMFGMPGMGGKPGTPGGY